MVLDKDDWIKELEGTKVARDTSEKMFLINSIVYDLLKDFVDKEWPNENE